MSHIVVAVRAVGIRSFNISGFTGAPFAAVPHFFYPVLNHQESRENPAWANLGKVVISSMHSSTSSLACRVRTDRPSSGVALLLPHLLETRRAPVLKVLCEIPN